MKLRFFLLPLALAWHATGCVAIETQGQGGEGGGACCLAAPACPDNAHQVDACETGQCFPVEACCSEIYCEPGPCVSPTCALDETQVGNCDGARSSECRAVEACGSTIYCHAADFCEAIPMCDDSDVEERSGGCPSGNLCYAVELCGATILCSDFGAQHGCPDEAPVEGQPCNFFDIRCDYPTGVDDCVETWHCGDPLDTRAPVPSGGVVWHLTAETCGSPPKP